MTRINCVPAKELTDKHLIAEYRELPRISGLAWGWARRTVYIKYFMDNLPPKWPTSYILGTNHVRFFYDKGEFLRKRFEEEIVPEMQARGFTTNYTKYRLHPEGLNQDWTPTEEALALNRERIAERLAK